MWFPAGLLGSPRHEHVTANHPIQRHKFMVQTFIDIGRYPRHHRVLHLFGTPHYTMRLELKAVRPAGALCNRGERAMETLFHAAGEVRLDTKLRS